MYWCIFIFIAPLQGDPFRAQSCEPMVPSRRLPNLLLVVAQSRSIALGRMQPGFGSRATKRRAGEPQRHACRCFFDDVFLLFSAKTKHIFFFIVQRKQINVVCKEHNSTSTRIYSKPSQDWRFCIGDCGWCRFHWAVVDV